MKRPVDLLERVQSWVALLTADVVEIKKWHQNPVFEYDTLIAAEEPWPYEKVPASNPSCKRIQVRYSYQTSV